VQRLAATRAKPFLWRGPAFRARPRRFRRICRSTARGYTQKGLSPAATLRLTEFTEAICPTTWWRSALMITRSDSNRRQSYQVQLSGSKFITCCGGCRAPRLPVFPNPSMEPEPLRAFGASATVCGSPPLERVFDSAGLVGGADRPLLLRVMPAFFRANPAAYSFRQYRSREIASRTRTLLDEETICGSHSTRETVAVDTPAFRATSLTVHLVAWSPSAGGFGCDISPGFFSDVHPSRSPCPARAAQNSTLSGPILRSNRRQLIRFGCSYRRMQA
jgi:hypothetical protein